MRTWRWGAAVICASLFWAMPAATQNVKAGVDAWSRGDYAGAVAIWRPLPRPAMPMRLSTWGRHTAWAGACSSI